MRREPREGDRIVTAGECRVATRVYPNGAIEYDLLRLIEVPNDPRDPNHGQWGLWQQRICDVRMWSYYQQQEGKLL